MNYTLQLHGERLLYRLPPGLSELMSDISRETLRQQPTHLYTFIADYLDTLLRLREAAKTGSRLVTDVLGDTRERLALVAGLGLNWEEANQAAKTIQIAYRGYRQRRYLLEKQRVLQSTSFKEYLHNIDMDWEASSQMSNLVDEAYQSFIRTRQDHEMEQEYSIHTIEGFAPPDLTKDSKVQVFEQTPRQSFSSSLWSDFLKGTPIQRESTIDKMGPLYRQTPSPELSHPRMISLMSSDVGARKYSSASLNEPQMAKPVIDEVGQLVKDTEDDIVTIYSIDSLYNSKKKISFPNLQSKKESFTSRSNKAQEIVNIIENRASRVSRFIQAMDSLDDGLKQRVEDNVIRKLSRLSRSTLKNLHLSKSKSDVKSTPDTGSNIDTESEQLQHV